MTLMRAAARTLLASVFVVDGLKTMRDPEAMVPVAEPFTDKVVPLAKKYAPQQVAATIPEDTVTLVRLGGLLQVAGGIGLATGFGRRVGATLLAASIVPKTLAANPLRRGLSAAERADQRAELLTNLGLLGGVLIASQDTEGRPSLAWRAHAGGEKIAKQGRKVKKQLEAEAKKATKDARKQAKKARRAISS